MSNSKPGPLLSTTISLVLEYITPPSLLSTLPPHLISPSLTQRHSFLHLKPDTPADYLSWPTDSTANTQQKAIDLLESLQKPLENHIVSIRYTSDPESAFAHVAISTNDPPGLRLVFQWDPPDGWKFHNLTLMPFPTNTYESVQEAATYEFLAEPSMSANEDEERDSYWDAYGLSSEDADNQSSLQLKADVESGTEDAYWAQYSAVQGSGDSTLPTPHTTNRKLANQNERVIVSYPHQRTSFAYDPLAPPSPRKLAHLLANISPRALSPLFAEDSDTTLDSGSGSDDSVSPKISPAIHSATISPTTDYPSSLLSLDTHTSAMEDGARILPTVGSPDDSRDALRDTIRSIYRLWKTGRLANSPTPNGDGDEFLEIVREAITESLL